MISLKKNLAVISLFTISVLFMLGFYGDVVFQPNDYMFSQDGDGIKNYFTYAYHIQHDSSLIHFQGMNYPYGEHYLYTDCHPILANSFQLASKLFPSITNYSIGFLNFAMLLSIFLTFLILYMLLREFELKKWIAVIFSLSIGILAPQIFRIGGHLALSYSLAIPWSWWLLLKAFNNRKYYIPLFINNFFWMFIHGYLGIIILFFLITLSIIHFLAQKEKKLQISHYSKIFASLILPILFFFLFTKFTDTHTERTTNPSGFFLYNAELDDVFLPHHSPIRPWLDKITNNSINLQWEAWSYMGVAVTLLSISLLLVFLYQLIHRKKSKYLLLFFQNKTLNYSIIAAFIVLIFAMAFPFKQIPALLDVFPILKQFRATGRFTWPFYFVWSVFAAYVFNQIYILLTKKGKQVIAIIIIGFIGLFNIIEGWSYHQEAAIKISKTPNLFKKQNLSNEMQDALKKINSNDYQAIIALPFYYYGSESFARPASQKALRSSTIISYHTGIPIVEAMLTRTSITESKKIVQLVSPDFYPKEIKADFPNNKPLLLINTGEELSENEKALWNKAQTIYNSKDIKIASLNLNDLWESSAEDIINNYKENLSQLYNRHHFMVSDSLTYFFYDDFETSPSDTSYRGKGAFHSIKRGKNTFAEFKPNTFDENATYEASIWMFNGEADALNLWFRFIIEEYDPVANKWYSTTYFPEFAETINGNWSLIKGQFKVHSQKNWIYIVSKGKNDSKATLHADDLLIREINTSIYKEQPNGSLFFNNDRINVVSTPFP